MGLMRDRFSVACYRVMVVTLSVCVSASATGCATYRAGRLPTYPLTSFRSSTTQGDVAVGAELWNSKEQSQFYFDTNLTKRGLVPVYVALVNHGKPAAMWEPSSCPFPSVTFQGSSLATS